MNAVSHMLCCGSCTLDTHIHTQIDMEMVDRSNLTHETGVIKPTPES